MAMTGMRRVTTGLGLLERTADARPGRPLLSSLVRRLRPDARQEVIELRTGRTARPEGPSTRCSRRRGRRTRWAGPLRLALWAFFETALVPLLGLRHAKRRTVTSRSFVAADHVLYGIVVGSRAPLDGPTRRRTPLR